MPIRNIILTGDVERKDPSAIRAWVWNPELDGYRWWAILNPFWNNGVSVRILSVEDYLKKDPRDYAFALVFSKHFAAFPRWPGRLVAYIHDLQSVINCDLDGYSGALAVYPNATAALSGASVPILWHPSLIYPEWTRELRRRPQSARKNFLVTGALDRYHYPERCRLHRSIRYSIKRRWKHGVRCSHRTGSCLVFGSWLSKRHQGQAWWNFLARHKTVIFAQNRWNYFVRKYSEIPACGCLMVAPDVRLSRKAGLVPGEHYLLIDVDRFWDTIEWIQANPGRAEEIRKNGMAWLREFRHYVCHDLFQENMDVILSA